MRARNTFFALAFGLLGLGATVFPASADDDGGFRIRFDPVVLEVLSTDVDTESAKFQEYRDLNSGFRIPRLHLEGEGAGGERYLDIRLSNADREDARYQLRYGVLGKYDILFDYNKIPHRFGENGHMLFTRTGNGRYEIADPVQAAIQSQVEAQFAISPFSVNFDFLDGVLQPHLVTATEVDLGLRRDRAFAKVELGKGGDFEWAIEYSHENREGTRPYGAAFGFNNVTELPEPIDYDTTGAAVTGAWQGERGVLTVGYRYSEFENNISTVIWDNPFRALDSTGPSAYLAPSGSSIDGSTLGFADLAPSNDANDLFLAGRWKIGGAWWLGGGASYIQMQQDEPLLPYTLNTAIEGIAFDGSTFDPTDPANLPVRQADTEVDVLSLNWDLGTRFAEDWSFVLRYRYYDYDNGSPRIEFPGYVRYHSVWEEVPRITVPYAYTRDEIGAELGWDVGRNTSLNLSYKLESWDREFREVESSDEDVLRFSVDSRPSRKFAVRAHYELGDRSIDAYDPEAQLFSFLDPEEEVNNLPSLRKYAQAARECDLWDVQLQFYPADSVTFFVGVNSRDDDYDESEFGLIADEIIEYSAEFTYTPGEKSTFYLFGTIADRDVFQAARQSGSTPSVSPLDNWDLALDETNDTYGLGWTGRWADRWSTDVTALYSKSDGDADFTAIPGGLPLAGPPPRTEATDFNNYEDIEIVAGQFKVDYRITDAIGAGFWYRYEDYTIDSFILQGLRNYLPGALLLNPELGDYTANLFALNLKLQF